MTPDLRLRLRRANPVQADEGSYVPDERVLRSILSEPRPNEQPSPTPFRRRRRRLVLVIAAIVLLAGTAAAASRLAVEYFDSDDSEPKPDAIVAALNDVSEASRGFIHGPVDAESFVRLAAFDTPRGRVTLYIAPVDGGRGFCVVTATGSKPDPAAGCGLTSDPDRTIFYTSFWSPGFGDTFPLFGRLPEGVTRIELRFEGGERRAVSVRQPWWIYVVSGDEAAPGNRPVEAIAINLEGQIVARQSIDPLSFEGQ